MITAVVFCFTWHQRLLCEPRCHHEPLSSAAQLTVDLSVPLPWLGVHVGGSRFLQWTDGARWVISDSLSNHCDVLILGLILLAHVLDSSCWTDHRCLQCCQNVRPQRPEGQLFPDTSTHITGTQKPSGITWHAKCLHTAMRWLFFWCQGR